MSAARRVSSSVKAVRQVRAHGCDSKSPKERVELYLQERIFSRQWPSGHKLPSEAKLQKQLGASRTVIREALRRLQGRGLLTTINGSGSYVSDGQLESVSQALGAYSALVSNEKTFSDLVDLRMAIEGDATAKVAQDQSSDDWLSLEARLAAMNAARVLEEFAILDIDFHMDILRLSGNDLFVSLGQALRDRYMRFAIDSYRSKGRLREETMQEHRHIVRTIRSGNPVAAREAARQHICRARTRWQMIYQGNAEKEVVSVQG